MQREPQRRRDEATADTGHPHTPIITEVALRRFAEPDQRVAPAFGESGRACSWGGQGEVAFAEVVAAPAVARGGAVSDGQAQAPVLVASFVSLRDRSASRDLVDVGDAVEVEILVRVVARRVHPSPELQPVGDAVDVAAGNYTTAASLVAAINTAAGGSTIAAVSGNEIVFTNSTANAITLGGAANPLGVASVAAQTTGAPVVTNGTVDSTAVAAAISGGGVTVDATNTLTVGSTAVADGSYATAQDLADAINVAYNTDGSTTGKTLATVVGGELHFENDDTGAAVTLAGAGTNAALLPASVAAASSVAGGTVDGTATTTGVNAAVTAAASATPLTLKDSRRRSQTAATEG